ncbi:hypothetical protein K443DRAFT_673124, partial [Laccaria amethystina LaAM-08-1]
EQRSGAHERGRPPTHAWTDNDPTATAHPWTTTTHGYHGPQRPPTHPQRPSI